jgi:hypothetical protein
MLHCELHDHTGRVEITELTENGRQEAIFQCRQLIEDIEALDDEEEDEE